MAMNKTPVRWWLFLIPVVDYNWCIGCRYCEAACPYHARRFNFSKPTVSGREINTQMGYLSNRIRPLGVIEKCTYCLHRTRLGKYHACHDVCPTKARKFGDLRDPQSEVRKILESVFSGGRQVPCGGLRENFNGNHASFSKGGLYD